MEREFFDEVFYDSSVLSKPLDAVRGFGNHSRMLLEANGYYTIGSIVNQLENVLNRSNSDESLALQCFTNITEECGLMIQSKKYYDLAFNHLLAITIKKMLSEVSYDKSIEDKPLTKITGIGKKTAQYFEKKFGIFKVGHLLLIFNKQIFSDSMEQMWKRYSTIVTEGHQYGIDNLWVKESFLWLWKVSKDRQTKKSLENEEPSEKRARIELSDGRKAILENFSCYVCFESKDSLLVTKCDHCICEECYSTEVYYRYMGEDLKCGICRGELDERPAELRIPYPSNN